MRLLALLLLVANLAFLGWRYLVEEEDRAEALRRDPPTPAGVPRVQVLSSQTEPGDLPPLPVLEQIPVVTATPTPTLSPDELAALSATSQDMNPAADNGSGVCVTNGPFARRSDADALVDWLKSRSARLQVRPQTLPATRRYALYLLPVAESDAMPEGAHPVEGNSLAHAILLGVLGTQSAATQRALQVDQTGYRPLVVPRLDAQAQWFVEAELANGFEDIGEVPPTLVPGGKVGQMDCAGL